MITLISSNVTKRAFYKKNSGSDPPGMRVEPFVANLSSTELQ